MFFTHKPCVCVYTRSTWHSQMENNRHNRICLQRGIDARDWDICALANLWKERNSDCGEEDKWWIILLNRRHGIPPDFGHTKMRSFCEWALNCCCCCCASIRNSVIWIIILSAVEEQRQQHIEFNIQLASNRCVRGWTMKCNKNKNPNQENSETESEYRISTFGAHVFVFHFFAEHNTGRRHYYTLDYLPYPYLHGRFQSFYFGAFYVIRLTRWLRVWLAPHSLSLSRSPFIICWIVRNWNCCVGEQYQKCCHDFLEIWTVNKEPQYSPVTQHTAILCIASSN